MTNLWRTLAAEFPPEQDIPHQEVNHKQQEAPHTKHKQAGRNPAWVDTAPNLVEHLSQRL